MLHEQFDASKMTIEQIFEARRRAKEERSQRLAELPFEKKIEIVQQFNEIVNSALKQDDERRAAAQRSPDEN
jgi:hypothetical protein